MCKRILSALCAAALIVMMMTACGADNPGSSSGTGSGEVTSSSSTLEPPGDGTESDAASDADSATESEPAESGADADASAAESDAGAEDESEPMSVSVDDGVIGYDASGPAQVEPSEENTAEGTAYTLGYYPFEIQYQDHNGAPLVIKSFKVPVDVDPEELVEPDFTEDNYVYSRRDLLKKEAEMVTETKTVAQAISFATEDNDQSSILANLTPVIEYNEGGFTGQLTLDYGSIASAATGETSYSYPITRVVEVNSLADNDYAFLDKEVDGLTLQGAEWNLNNGVQRAENMIPGSYNTQAVYTGTGYGTKIDGYNNTAYYTGTVTRAFEGDIIYSVVYKGVRDPSTVVVAEDFPWAGVLAVIMTFVAIAVVLWFLRDKIIPLFGRRRKAPPPVSVD